MRGEVMADGRWPLKVMVVDGHSVFAEALALAIDATDDLRCVGTARDVEQALTLADAERPDVAVMDVPPDAGDPVPADAPASRTSPRDRVLVLTGLPVSPALVRDAADSGPAGSSRSPSASASSSRPSLRCDRTPSPSIGPASSRSAPPRPASSRGAAIGIGLVPPDPP